jgi:lactate dehydrogenase-like 2-hydroxyacid dehydrogenase
LVFIENICTIQAPIRLNIDPSYASLKLWVIVSHGALRRGNEVYMEHNIIILERNSVGTDIDTDCLQDFGKVTAYSNTVTPEEAGARIADVHADIVIANKVPINARTLEKAGGSVKLIAEFATGYDNVDINYCNEHHIAVANLGSYATDSVAQHTFTLALCILEHIHFYDTYVKSGDYARQDRFSNFDAPFTELAGKTWGIAGMGNIGRRVAEIAAAFGCHVVFYPTSGRSSCTEFEQVDLDTLLRESDILSIHCPLTDRTRHLIDAGALAKMKHTAIIINVARGAVVDNTALYDALINNRIGGAGLDVLENEPIRPDDVLSQYHDSNRLIITPHMAWASTEARKRCVSITYDNIKNFLNGTPTHIVNSYV